MQSSRHAKVSCPVRYVLLQEELKEGFTIKNLKMLHLPPNSGASVYTPSISLEPLRYSFPFSFRRCLLLALLYSSVQLIPGLLEGVPPFRTNFLLQAPRVIAQTFSTSPSLHRQTTQRMSAIEQLLSGALSLVGNLTAVQQNGLSLHGTLDAPTLPAFLPHNDTSQEFPWGNMTAKNSNPSIPPTTGVTRTYDLTISRSVIQPDGVSKNVILVNGQFPGPSIEANWVCSNIPYDLEFQLTSSREMRSLSQSTTTSPTREKSLEFVS